MVFVAAVFVCVVVNVALSLPGLARLERCTRYWPMVISETVLGNLIQVGERIS